MEMLSRPLLQSKEDNQEGLRKLMEAGNRHDRRAHAAEQRHRQVEARTRSQEDQLRRLNENVVDWL